MEHPIYSPKHGARRLDLDVWFFSSVSRDEYIAPIPEEERKDIVLAYHAQLNSSDDETRLTAAKAWSKWEYVKPSRHPWI